MRFIWSFVILFLTSLVFLTVLAAIPPAPFNEKSVMYILVDNGSGTGVYIGNGKIITDAHVIGKQTDVIVMTIPPTHVTDENSDEVMLKGKVVKINKKQDLAYIQLEKTPVDVPAAVLDCKPPVIGVDVEAMGYAGRFGLFHSYGKVGSKVLVDPTGKAGILTTAPLFPGMSGGPVVHDGKVIGFSEAIIMIPTNPETPKFRSFTGLNLIIPAVAVCDPSFS